MEYDDRIMNTGLILNCFNTEFVEKNGYKNKFGYFSNCIESYRDLSKCKYGKLTNIDHNHTPYECGTVWHYSFFLPEGAVKPTKKKCIPFKYLNELQECGLQVGKVITIRNNNYPEVNSTVIITEINYNPETNEVIDITLGATGFEFETLLESYSFYNENKWQSFGVEE